jgi:predicted nucleic-acid-binding Zn-ribbon protein
VARHSCGSVEDGGKLPSIRRNSDLSDFVHFTAGTFEAWVCAACGFTEYYAKDINEALSVLARIPSSGVSCFDGDQTPYR